MNVEEFAEVVATLGEDDFTKDGEPKMKPLNAALLAAGHAEMEDAGERDQWMADWEASLDPDQDAPDPDDIFPDVGEEPTEVTITVTRSNDNPVNVQAAGKRCSLRVGQPATVSVEVMGVLDAANIEYEVEG